MIAITKKGSPDKALQDISPEELKSLTRDTYTNYKHKYISAHHDFTDFFSQADFYYPLSEYIERLEYELKVVKEM